MPQFFGVFQSKQVLTFQLLDATTPQLQYNSSSNWDSQRRVLNRAATTDFGADRESSYFNGTRQGSGLLEPSGSPGAGGLSAHNLRAAKSFADLRSYTPSPVPSTQSFPANLSLNVSRFVDNSYSSGTSGTPKNITPTSATGLSSREDQFINSMSNMSLGGRQNARLNQDNHNPSAGAIGSHRPVNGNNYEDSLRNGASAVPERQPRGPVNEWGGFRRQNGHVNRGSGELNLKLHERRLS